MTFIKWFLYFLALGAFIWYVFLRKITAEALKPAAIEAVSELENIDSDSVANQTDQTEDTDLSEEEIWEDIDSSVIVSNDDWSESDNVVPVENPKDEEDNESEIGNQESSESEPIVEKPLTQLNLDARYLVVIGSFGSKANANRLLDKVSQIYPDSEISFINGLNRVVIASYDEENAAEQKKSNYISSTGGSAFVLAQ